MKLKTIQMKRTIRNVFITIGFLISSSLMPQMTNTANSKMATTEPRMEIKTLVMLCENVNMADVSFQIISGFILIMK